MVIGKFGLGLREMVISSWPEDLSSEILHPLSLRYFNNLEQAKCLLISNYKDGLNVA
jgi:hypothetical protein